MKKFVLMMLTMIVLLASCASTPPAVSGLVSVNDAINAAATEIEAKVAAGSEIAVYRIIAPSAEIENLLCAELNKRFTSGGKLKALDREAVLRASEGQTSGTVSDSDAVSIGNELGAKVVVSGTFDRYEGFYQLRLRAVDVLSSAQAAMYTARISSNDPALGK